MGKQLAWILGCIICLMSSLSGCVTPSEEKQFKDDIVNLKTRVLQLEEHISKNSGVDLAATQTRHDQIKFEIQKINGEIDALKVGVTSGKMPGVEGGQEGSVSVKMDELQTRMDSIEADQQEILEAIEKSATNGGKSAKGEKNIKSSATKEIKEIKDAYKAKKFKFVIENSKAVLGKGSKKDQEEVRLNYAESLYKLGKLKDAALQYNEFVDSFSSSPKIPHAKMRMGDCFRHLGDNTTAKLYYTDLVEKHSRTEEGKKAKERLAGK